MKKLTNLLSVLSTMEFLFFLRPYSDLFAISKNKLDLPFDYYLEFWSHSKGIQFFQKIYCKFKKPWYYHSTLNRETIVTISRLCPNHYNLNHSLFRKNLIADGSCLCGYLAQDINHVVFSCLLTKSKPLNLRAAIFAEAGSHLRDIFLVLKNPSAKIFRLIMAFCKICNFNI